jgi:hypothetical protein
MRPHSRLIAAGAAVGEPAGAFPNLEHGWDTGCTRPGEGGPLSTKFRTSHRQRADCSHLSALVHGLSTASPQSHGQATPLSRVGAPRVPPMFQIRKCRQRDTKTILHFANGNANLSSPFLIWNMGGTRGAPARERGVPCPQSSGLHTDSMRTVHTWAILQKQLCKYTEPTRPCPWIVRGESTKSWTSRPPPLAGGSRCPTGVPN